MRAGWLVLAAAAVLALHAAGVVGKTSFYATDPAIVFDNGRTEANTSDGSVSYDWSGVTMHAGFTGSSMVAVALHERTAWAPAQSNVFMATLYAMSSGTQTTMTVTTDVGTHSYTLFDALDPADTYQLTLFKLTEPDFNAVVPVASQVTVLALVLDDSGALVAAAVPDYLHRVLVIGDSLSAGFGALGIPPCEATVDNESNYVAWNRLVCRAIGAECQVLAWSGMGIVQNYNTTGTLHLPQAFQRTFASDAASTFTDWASWVPDAVFINAGSNDYAHAPNAPTPAVFGAAMFAFMETIAAAYSTPSVPFFLFVGPVTNAYEPGVHVAIEAALDAGYTAYFVSNVGLLVNASDVGCLGHPSVLGHEAMAAATLPVLATVLNWTSIE